MQKNEFMELNAQELGSVEGGFLATYIIVSNYLATKFLVDAFKGAYQAGYDAGKASK